MAIRFLVVLVLGSLAASAAAQEIQRGRLKELDLTKRRIVITVDGRDRELDLTDETRVLDRSGTTLAERFRGLNAGDDIFFQLRRDDGREVRAVKSAAGAPRPAQPAGDAQRATIRKVDLERQTITLSLGEQAREVLASDRTEMRGVAGTTLRERLQTLTPDTRVLFRARRQDDRDELLALMVVRDEPRAGRRILEDTSSLRPLTEMGEAKYQGFAGGLYPDGRNERPESHEAAGLRWARRVEPLDANGRPDPQGRIVLLSIGMSNTSQLSQGLERWLRQADGLHPRLLFVNGAQGGMTAAAIQSTEEGRGQQYWTTVDRRLEAAGATRAQVQAVWIKQADAGPSSGFPAYAQTLQAELTRIVQLLPGRFPNCRMAYLSSRTYGGFATTPLNPEPYAFESGYSVKWLIERQIRGEADLNFDPDRGPVKSPWLSWGPYLWANGATPRTDGFRYAASDFAPDGTHHAAEGERKVSRLLLDFFTTDATTKPWFRAAR